MLWSKIPQGQTLLCVYMKHPFDSFRLLVYMCTERKTTKKKPKEFFFSSGMCHWSKKKINSNLSLNFRSPLEKYFYLWTNQEICKGQQLTNASITKCLKNTFLNLNGSVIRNIFSAQSYRITTQCYF